MLRILAIGDVTSPKAAEALARALWEKRKETGADLVIVNAENAGFITGATPEVMETLLLGGADCLTGGNHTLRNRRSHTFLEETKEVIRPVNFGDSAPGRGYTTVDVAGYRVLVINAMGQVNIDPVLDSPIAILLVASFEEITLAGVIVGLVAWGGGFFLSVNLGGE